MLDFCPSWHLNCSSCSSNMLIQQQFRINFTIITWLGGWKQCNYPKHFSFLKLNLFKNSWLDVYIWILFESLILLLFKYFTLWLLPIFSEESDGRITLYPNHLLSTRCGGDDGSRHTYRFHCSNLLRADRSNLPHPAHDGGGHPCEHGGPGSAAFSLRLHHPGEEAALPAWAGPRAHQVKWNPYSLCLCFPYS